MDISSVAGQKYYRDLYRDELLNNTVPFWFPRSIDQEYGGFFTCFGRRGERLQTDKAVWFQGRFTWMLATLCLAYPDSPQKEQWLEYAKKGIEFIDRYCFDSDGHMFFQVTQDGKPIRKRRYVFSETFTIIAKAAYATASGIKRYADEALALFKTVIRNLDDSEKYPPKCDPINRPINGLGLPMILMNVAQELRKAIEDPLPLEIINQVIEKIETRFMKPEYKMVLENVGPAGELIDTFEGRSSVPGHAIEAAWFIMEEARRRNGDRHLIELGTKILDWSLAAGWDERYGGIYYYRDCKGYPSSEYAHDMKFWWPHNETIIATILAWKLTGNDKYAAWHKKVHDWTYSHFPDPIHGEWFGYLHRDGTVSTELKGNMWKGFFHLPRMLWYCGERLDELVTNY